MSKKLKNKTTATTVSTASTKPGRTSARENQTETSYKLGKIIAKVFNVSPKTASLISKSIISLAGSVVSIVTVLVALLKGLGVI